MSWIHNQRDCMKVYFSWIVLRAPWCTQRYLLSYCYDVRLLPKRNSHSSIGLTDSRWSSEVLHFVRISVDACMWALKSHRFITSIEWAKCFGYRNFNVVVRPHQTFSPGYTLFCVRCTRQANTSAIEFDHHYEVCHFEEAFRCVEYINSNTWIPRISLV